jgi:hypothetical protein
VGFKEFYFPVYGKELMIGALMRVVDHKIRRSAKYQLLTIL